MAIIVHKFNPDIDYQIVATWWAAHKWPVLGLDSLGPNGFMAIDSESKEKLACGWVYKLEGANLCLMEWLIGNPEVGYKVRGLGLDAVIESCSNFAKERSCLALFTMAKHTRLKERYSKLGFQETDSNMTHFVRRLD